VYLEKQFLDVGDRYLPGIGGNPRFLIRPLV